MANSAGHVQEGLQLTIAGIGIELTWAGGRPMDEAEEPARQPYARFVSNGHRGRRATQVNVRLHVHCGELPNLTPDALVFDAVSNHWRLFHANGHEVFEVFDTMPPHLTVQLAVMRPGFRTGDLYRRPEPSSPTRSWSLTRLMRPFGELLLINLLSQGRGVLLHALGVSDQGEGLLFIGRSGAGKTTLANLYKPHRGVTILGDELVVVTKEDGRFWLSGTPWPGDGLNTVSADTVPLRKVFFLEHGMGNRLISDRFLTLYGLFFQQLFLPFWNREALAFALRFGEELLSSVPAARLAFVNDARVIEFLRSQRDE
jgi:hypothetical protein